MNWFQFMKVDFRLIKCQRLALIVFPLLAVALGVKSGSALFIVSYMCFGVMVDSVTLFSREGKNMSSFIQLLPGDAKGKVMGRYACFLVMILAVVLFGTAVSAVLSLSGYLELNVLDYYFCMAVALVSILIGCVQMAAFYILGRVNGEQWMHVIRMLPAFLFFFLAGYVSDLIGEKEKFAGTLSFINQNRGILLVMGIVISAAVFAVCISISSAVVSRRDIE